MVSADYIVGLTDGEGCFYINLRPPSKYRPQWRVEPHFHLKMRADELPLLREVRDSFGCGTVYFQKEKRVNHAQCYRFTIGNPKEIEEILIPFFQKHPLRSQKKQNFDLFCRVVSLTDGKQRIPDEKVEVVRQLKQKMNHGARPVRENRSPGGNAT